MCVCVCVCVCVRVRLCDCACACACACVEEMYKYNLIGVNLIVNNEMDIRSMFVPYAHRVRYQD